MRECQPQKQVVSADQLESAPLLDNPGPAHLAACLLLAGGLKASQLAAATGISPLDLHLTPRATVLDAWLRQCQRLGSSASALDVRIIHGEATPPPAPPRHIPPGVRLMIERDTRQYRGPAGIARDICSVYPADSTILIGEAARFIAADLAPVLAIHHQRRADITVVCNADSSPAGVFIAQRSTLDLVPRAGFMDLKEQWLTRAVSQGLYVRVHRLSGNPSFELRTTQQFLLAAQAAGTAALDDLAPGAQAMAAHIAPGAVLVDSVIMPGAVIPERCIIVRSIVCAGARVEAGATIIDQVVRRGHPPRRLPGRLAERG
jgi:hypothetical protein